MNKCHWDEFKKHLPSSKWIPFLMLQTLLAGVCILLSTLRASDIGVHTKLIWIHRILDKNMFLFEKGMQEQSLRTVLNNTTQTQTSQTRGRLWFLKPLELWYNK